MRGSSTVAATMTALNLIDSDAPRSRARGVARGSKRVAPAVPLSMRFDHPWIATLASYHKCAGMVIRSRSGQSPLADPQILLFERAPPGGADGILALLEG